MKRTIFVVAGLVAATVAYFVGQTGAQPGVVTAPPTAATKVGMVNIGYIFSKYEKVQLFKKEFERDLKPFRDEEEKLKKLIIDWQNALNNPKSELTEQQKDQGKRTITDCKRRLEDLSIEYRKKVQKKTEEQLVQLYKEVNDSIKTHATTYGFHIILGFGEPMDGDLLSFVNVTRKMQAMDQGAVIPMYYAGWMDVSPQVLATLNAKYAPGGGSATGTGGGPK